MERTVLPWRRQSCQIWSWDVVMPGMNGFQATRQISKGKDTQHIPVVIVSTKDQATDRVWGKRQGACDLFDQTD